MTTSRRRGRGEGSITKRADGRWEARLDLGYVDGTRRHKSVYGRTRNDVAQKLRQQQQRQDSGELLLDERMTLTDWLTHWVDDVLPTRVANATLSDSTRDSYAEMVRLHLIPVLGRHRLTKLQAAHIDKFIATKRTMRKADGSPLYKANTLRLMRTTLRKAINDAVKSGRLNRNVVDASEPINVPRRAQQFLTVDESRRLLSAVEGDRLSALYVLLLSLGLRKGEALALRWSDVDLTAGTVSISRSLKRLRNPSLPDGTRPSPATRLEFGSPKTADSYRTQALPAPVVERLTQHRRRQAAERLAAATWVDLDLVFTTPVGTPVDPANLGKYLSLAAKSAGLGHRNPHQLRHSAATIMLAQGIPLHEVSKVLGHSSITVTNDVYGHLVAERGQAAANAMGDALRGVPGGT